MCTGGFQRACLGSESPEEAVQAQPGASEQPSALLAGAGRGRALRSGWGCPSTSAQELPGPHPTTTHFLTSLWGHISDPGRRGCCPPPGEGTVGWARGSPEAWLWGVWTGLDPRAQSSAPELPTPKGLVCLQKAHLHLILNRMGS